MKPRCQICKERTSIPRGAILSDNGIICPKCCRERLDGMDFHIRYCPKVIVDSAKIKAEEQGLNFRTIVIRLIELYGKGESL